MYKDETRVEREKVRLGVQVVVRMVERCVVGNGAWERMECGWEVGLVSPWMAGRGSKRECKWGEFERGVRYIRVGRSSGAREREREGGMQWAYEWTEKEMAQLEWFLCERGSGVRRGVEREMREDAVGTCWVWEISQQQQWVGVTAIFHSVILHPAINHCVMLFVSCWMPGHISASDLKAPRRLENALIWDNGGRIYYFASNGFLLRVSESESHCVKL